MSFPQLDNISFSSELIGATIVKNQHFNNIFDISGCQEFSRKSIIPLPHHPLLPLLHCYSVKPASGPYSKKGLSPCLKQPLNNSCKVSNTPLFKTIPTREPVILFLCLVALCRFHNMWLKCYCIVHISGLQWASSGCSPTILPAQTCKLPTSLSLSQYQVPSSPPVHTGTILLVALMWVRKEFGSRIWVRNSPNEIKMPEALIKWRQKECHWPSDQGTTYSLPGPAPVPIQVNGKTLIGFDSVESDPKDRFAWQSWHVVAAWENISNLALIELARIPEQWSYSNTSFSVGCTNLPRTQIKTSLSLSTWATIAPRNCSLDIPDSERHSQRSM